MECQRCHNTNPRLFYKEYGQYYCRRCIQFSKQFADVSLKQVRTRKRKADASLVMDYELTLKQKKTSEKILKYLKEGKDVFVFAATGAGKTELCFESIQYFLKQKKKVGFAISRRQVVLEIAQRLQDVFPNLDVVAVTKDHTSLLDGDIIVCTMHQLFRYFHTFDLLILDELDAFPYAGNEVLENIMENSCKGLKLMLSATPNEKIKEDIRKGKMMEVRLFERPHGHPLIVPKIICLPDLLQAGVCLWLCLRLIKEKKQVLVFVPTKKLGKQLAGFFKLFFKCAFVHSSSAKKDEIIENFRKKNYSVLISTTLLERGITIKNVQVIVIQSDHLVFNTASLIQIFGRVGRNFNNPKGKAYCLCQKKTKSIQECVRQIQRMNHSA